MNTYRNQLKSVYQQLRTPARKESLQRVHPGLWLDKALESQENTKSRLVKEVSGIAMPEIYRHMYAAWEQRLHQAKDIYIQPVRATNRIIIGLGNESVMETGITLHHTYGVPYLPGSALKGLAASYAHQQLKGDWVKGGELHQVVFGDTDNAGFITFLDALYIPPAAPEPMLYQDVITVHHPLYYRNEPGAAPTDSDSPTPIPFVSTSGCYLLALATPDLQDRDPWLKATWHILEQALQLMGIGAKTSSGYGRMEFVRSPEEEARWQEEKIKQKELQKARELEEMERQRTRELEEAEIQKTRDLEESEIQKTQMHVDTLVSLRPEVINGERSRYYNLWRSLQFQSTKLLLGRAILSYVSAGNPKKNKLPEDDKDYQEVRIYVEQHGE